ncbi:MAG: Na+/H+ antiporter NhaA [Deltaproteobacteria bacterium]|nr:Na+/H+ antiporter NhaA [Deltaproteobacteria bacterium]
MPSAQLDPVTPGPSRPPGAWGPLLRFKRLAGLPLERFLKIEAASGVMLLVAAAIALAWANSPLGETYQHFWHAPIGIRVASWSFERPLEWYVNDVLMVIFFFLVGLEIRREIHQGELSEWRRAALPALAAVGGMIAPAIIYLIIAGKGESHSGWGVPMATDIAFAVGVLALLGKRVPPALRVLLLALAVIDDLGAIVVIALFYSSGIKLIGLLIFALGICGMFVMQGWAVRHKLAYVLPAFVTWLGAYLANVHPTISGVVLGLITPVVAWLGPTGFVKGIEEELRQIHAACGKEPTPLELAAPLRRINFARREALSPAQSLIDTLHPWVAYLIMPLFALANAGVAVSGVAFDPLSLKITLGAGLGLLIGKPIGVVTACVLSIRLRIATLPLGLGARHLTVLGVTAGIGFTMALFVAQLAFDQPALLAPAKLGVLMGSSMAAVCGLLLGRLLLPRAAVVVPGAAQTVDEAEQSTVA